MVVKTWSLTLKEECWVRVFENRILRRIFGPKSDENIYYMISTSRLIS